MRYQGAYQLGPLSQILCGQKGVNGIADGDAKPFWVAADLITEENPRRQLCDDLEDARFQDHLVPFCKTLLTSLTYNETLLIKLTSVVRPFFLECDGRFCGKGLRNTS